MRFAVLGSRGFPSTYSGYETLVRHLAPYIVDQGHSVTVYGRRRESGRARWSVDGIECVATRGWDTKSLSTPSFGLSSSIDATRRGFDAALVLNLANGFWLPVLRAAGIPTAVNTDGLEWERGKWNRVARSVFRMGAQLTAAHATQIVCDSIAIGETWESLFGRRSLFIPYGAPVLRGVGRDKLEEQGLAGRPYVLSVARLVPENNVELMLDAVELLATDDVVPVVVGSAVGPTRLEERLRSLHSEGKAVWMGHVADQELLAQLWAHCAVYVHGHSVGGTNPSLLQAMGAGAPVLALDTRFNAEVLAERAQLYPLDVGALAASIAGLLESEGRRAHLGERGRAEVARRYSWEGVCRAYLDLLVSLAERRPPRRRVRSARRTRRTGPARRRAG